MESLGTIYGLSVDQSLTYAFGLRQSDILLVITLMEKPKNIRKKTIKSLMSILVKVFEHFKNDYLLSRPSVMSTA